MALINCKECGKQISDSAIQCPHCGCATQFSGNVEKAKRLNIDLIITCIFSIVGLVLFSIYFPKLINGINHYDSFVRWLKKDAEALNTYVLTCVSLGTIIGTVIRSIKIRGAARWQAHLMETGQIGSNSTQTATYNNPASRIPDELLDGTEEDEPFRIKPGKSAPNSWKCSCGRTNAVYVSTCCCGKNKGER